MKESYVCIEGMIIVKMPIYVTNQPTSHQPVYNKLTIKDIVE